MPSSAGEKKLAEIGAQTPSAPVGLAARFAQSYPVVVGTTLGMMIANITAAVVGDRAAGRLPIRAVRQGAGKVCGPGLISATRVCGWLAFSNAWRLSASAATSIVSASPSLTTCL